MEVAIEATKPPPPHVLDNDETSESSLASSSNSTTRSSTRRKSSLKPTPVESPLPNQATKNKLRSLNNVKFESDLTPTVPELVENGDQSSKKSGEQTGVKDENRPIIRTSSRRQATPKQQTTVPVIKKHLKLENVTATVENQDKPKTGHNNRRLSLKSPNRKRQKPSVFCPNDENTLDGFGTVKAEPIGATNEVKLVGNSKCGEANESKNLPGVDLSGNEESLSRLSGVNGGSNGGVDNEDSQSQQEPAVTGDGKKVKKERKKRVSNYGLYNQIESCITSVTSLFIYKWPLKEDLEATESDEVPDTYLLQEQVSELLGVKSFKRKYPDLFRRLIDFKERVYLQENKVVTETQCDLGLTALRLSECLDIMVEHYPDRYTELSEHLARKKRIELANSVLNINNSTESTGLTNGEATEPVKTGRFGRVVLSEAERMKELMRKAMKSATAFNQNLQKEKMTERRVYFDTQTMRIQKNRQACSVAYKCGHPNGLYPVALLQGQYQHHYKKYTSDELKYLPVNTILYPSETPIPILYDEWKMKQQNPTKTYRTFKKIDSSDDEDLAIDRPPELSHQPTQITLPSTTPTTLKSQQHHQTTSKQAPLTVNAHLLSQHHTAAAQQSQSEFCIKVSAAPTVASLISQKQHATSQVFNSSLMNSKTPNVAPLPVFKSCYVCAKSSQINVANATAANTDMFMVHCKSCDRYSHPTCLELNPALVKWHAILDYHWQCMDCKKCSACQDPHDEEKMMFCDRCDRGYHTYCVGLTEVPSGSFFCQSCHTLPDTSKSIPMEQDIIGQTVKSQIFHQTPIRIIEKLKSLEKTSEKGTTPKERGSTNRRGRPLGSLNKPKDPNSPKKIPVKKLKKQLENSLNYSNYGDLSQSMHDTNSNTMPFHNEVSQDGSFMHEDHSQSLSYENFKNISNINLNSEGLTTF